MLVFADTAWHVFSAAIVFLAGILAAVAIGKLFKISRSRAIFFYLWHSAFCLFYFYYSLNNTADATLYYIRSLDYDLGIAFGTSGVYLLTSIFSAGLGLSYGGVFLVYNIFGFIGMLAFASALQQINSDKARIARRVSLVALLLPGLSFWSSAIGKDAITFMATGLVTWGALDFSRRYPALVIATIAFVLVRPHMAGILLASIAFALLFSSGLGLVKKTFLTMLAVPATVAAVAFGLQYAGLGEVDGIGDVTEYFEARQGHNLGGGSSVDIASMSVPMRMLTYLFRPFFFDAGGLLGLFVSFENLFLAILILTATLFVLKGRRVKFDRFAFILFASFIVISWVVLANSTANLGIAIRQKWMFLPMLLLLTISYTFKSRK